MGKSFTKKILWTALLVLISCSVSVAEDGYEFWLRYHQISDKALLEEYRQLCRDIVVTESTPILDSAKAELIRGLSGLLAQKPSICEQVSRNGSIIVGTLQKSKVISDAIDAADAVKLKPDGFLIRSVKMNDKQCTIITGNSDRAVLYGVFHFLRLLQTHQSIKNLSIVENPANPLRMVNHWDNPYDHPGRMSIERGYAGDTIFHWDELPKLNPRYKDYARMLASMGINGIVINNVNTAKKKLQGWKLLQSFSMEKMATLAGLLRQYGVKFYVSINFASPILIGGLKTADPLEPAVKEWWADKADEIYKAIPDFGGFLVKADSEGEAGPHGYSRTHAEGANMLAEVLKPYGGLVLWRAFGVRSTEDKVMGEYASFHPLDGKFADNVVIQVKNYPKDFQVREAIHPLLGGLRKSNEILELQITQEYTGHAIHLCYLVPHWKEILDFDTYANGKGSAVKKIVSGSLFGYKHSGITGVANIGSDRNWTGHHLAQANTYGFGRLVWNPNLSAGQIADEWVKMTFGHDPQVVKTITDMLLWSYPIYENYTSPLGTGFMCAGSGSNPFDNSMGHFDPDPAHRQKEHRADAKGVGYDRTLATGSGYTGQYYEPVAKMYESLKTCPDELLLWFHHVPYTYRLKSGKTVIQHIYDSHFDGIEQARGLRDDWKKLMGKIDEQRYRHVLDRLNKQVEHAKIWRDSINTYFYEMSKIPDDRGRPLATK